MIEANGVTKRFGDFVALQDVSFQIGHGEVVGLLGPNGAGKTTLIRTLTGYFEPSDGNITVDGFDTCTHPLEVRRRIGYLPESTPLYPDLLVQEYLQMAAEMHGLIGDGASQPMAEAIWATGLEEVLTKPIGLLSKGFRQRVGLAQAILHRPRVLVLDEPTSGLDPTQVVQVRELVERLAATTTVLFSTHVLSEVEHICERAIVVLGGRVRADARLEELRSGSRLIVSVAAEGLRKSEALDKLAKLSEVTDVEDHPAPQPGFFSFGLTVKGTAGHDLGRRVFQVARESGWELSGLEPTNRDLETVFRDLVAEDARAAALANVRLLETAQEASS